MSIHVHLERFEGPLGLLLYLIRQEEMDIFDINIHQITRQYLEYIKAMRRLDLEVAGEFVAMAATLLHVKSRMLLPQHEGEDGEVAQDPRKELVQKLVEYQKIQELAQQLYARPLLGRDLWSRGERETFSSEAEGDIIVEENPLFSLIASYRRAMKAMRSTVHRVLGELQSIAARILEIKDQLIVGQRVGFRQLVLTSGPSTSDHILVTFLSLLELAKMNFISLFQSDNFTEIHVETKRTIDRDIVSQVENYDSVHAAEKAEALIENAQLELTEPSLAEPALETGADWQADAATDEEILAEESRLQLNEEPHEEIKDASES